MDPKQVARQMMKYHKIAFDSTFDTMIIIQEQIENAISRFLEQNILLPVDGKTAINDWVKAYKKGRTDFKDSVDDNYRKVEDFFVGQDKGNNA
jgi:predicted nucleic-acid-binding protein